MEYAIDIFELSTFRYVPQNGTARRTNIRSVDLCAILGNLLDNAIEAAWQVPDRLGRAVNPNLRPTK